MKVLALITLLSTLSAPLFSQQTKTVAYGRITLQFSPDFQQELNDIDGELVSEGQGQPGGTYVLPIAEGVYDLQQSSGEFQVAGGVGVRIGSNLIQVLSLRADLTFPSTPVITGWFVINGAVQPREAVFLLTQIGAEKGCRAQADVLCLPTYKVSLSKEAAQTVNSFLQYDAIAEGMDVGVANIYGILAQPQSIY